jgi:hypothetical protein
MAVPTLTGTSVLAAAAARQGLAGRPFPGDIPGLARALVSLHATEPTSVYLSAWARLEGFERDDMDQALFDEHSVVRWLAMRRTMWVVASDDLPMVHQAVVPRLLGPEQRRLHKLMVLGELADQAGAAARAERIEADILAVVAELGQAYGTEISARVPEMKTTYPYALDKPYGGHFSLGSRINSVVCMRGGLVRARPRGGWRSNQYSYALRESWLPGIDPEAVEPARARRQLVRRYLEAFGPAGIDDIQWWTGFTKGEVREAVAALGDSLVTVAVQGEEGERLVPASSLPALDAAPRLDPGCVQLLPSLDPWVMATKHRRRLMGAAAYRWLHDRNGNAGPSILAGGRVVGGWAQHPDGTVRWRLFEDVGAEATRAVAAQAERLETFLGAERVMPNFPTPLMRELRG